MVIGPGCAQRWQVAEQWDEIAFNIAKIFDVPVINPVGDYDDLESMPNDSWHFVQHPDTVARLCDLMIASTMTVLSGYHIRVSLHDMATDVNQLVPETFGRRWTFPDD